MTWGHQGCTLAMAGFPRLGDAAPKQMPPPVLPPVGDIKMTRLIDLKPFLKNINCKFMVLKRVEEPKSTKEGGFIYSFRVADESGMVIANFWNEVGGAIKPGDILLMTGGYYCRILPVHFFSFVTMFKNQIRLACKLGTVMRTGRLTMVINDVVDISKPLWLPNPENEHELVKQEEKK